MTPPAVRLAFGGPVKALAAGLAPPAVRLALSLGGGGTRNRAEKVLSPPDVRLAIGGHQNARREIAIGHDADIPREPGLLVSYVYLPIFQRERSKYAFRDWVMDSGAFSAHASGKPIDCARYGEACKELVASDPALTEIYALDVIGDWRASLKNTEQLWAMGVEAIPAYHVGEPEDVLVALARDYPKIALGGAVGLPAKTKLAWAKQAFARIWPKKVHGFGFGSAEAVMELPFHSVDATNWESGPTRFGNWRSLGKVSVRGGSHDLRGEVRWYMKVEERAQQKWAALWKEVGL